MRLIQLEFLKMAKNRTFLVMIILFFVSLCVFMTYGDRLFAGTNLRTFHSFPKVWYFNAYATKWFAYILGIIAISTITMEIRNKTLRQNVVDGMGRIEFGLSKILFFMLLSITTGVVVFLVTLITAYPAVEQGVSITDEIHWLFISMLYIFGYMMLSYNIGLLIKKTGLSVVLLIVYVLMVEPLLTSDKVGNLPDLALPGEAFSSMIPFMFPIPGIEQPSPETEVFIAAFVHILILVGISLMVLKKRNL